MSSVRHIFVCEGYSERAYIKSLQAFLEKLPTAHGAWTVPLQFFTKDDYVAGNGSYGALEKCYHKAKAENRNSKVNIWADFDLYQRDDAGCSRRYAIKGMSLPDFHFSFHNFEDFIALHTSGDELREWLSLGNEGYFENPAPSPEHSELIKKIVKGYRKGSLPADFVTKERLMNLKANLSSQPKSNPHRLQNIGKFADFLVGQLERHHPEVFR